MVRGDDGADSGAGGDATRLAIVTITSRPVSQLASGSTRPTPPPYAQFTLNVEGSRRAKGGAEEQTRPE